MMDSFLIKQNADVILLTISGDQNTKHALKYWRLKHLAVIRIFTKT